MFSISASKSLLFSLVLVLALSVAGSSAFAQSSRNTRDSAGSVASAQVVDVNDVVTHPNQYVGKEVTVQWKIDRVYSPTAIGLEKDEHHLLVVALPSASLSNGEMKKGEPVTLTGIVCNFDRAAFDRQYGKLNYGDAPLGKFKNKPVLIVTGAQSARVEEQAQEPVAQVQPPTAEESTSSTEQQSTSSTEQQAAIPPTVEQSSTPLVEQPSSTQQQSTDIASNEQPAAPSQQELPRTASSLPGLALAGLIATILGLGIPRLRRQE